MDKSSPSFVSLYPPSLPRCATCWLSVPAGPPGVGLLYGHLHGRTRLWRIRAHLSGPHERAGTPRAGRSPGAETAYVPNGTTLRQRREAGRLRQWGLESGGYILFLGRFSPEKNCDFLVRAYEQMDTPVKLVLAGGRSFRGIRPGAPPAPERSDSRSVSGEALDELLTNAMLFVLLLRSGRPFPGAARCHGSRCLRPGQRYPRESRTGRRVGLHLPAGRPE